MFATHPRNRLSAASLAIFAVALITAPAFAAPVGVPNASFENPATATFALPIPDWTGTADNTPVHGVADAVTQGFPAGADDGTQYAFLNLSFNGNTTSEITSNATLIGNIAAATDYTLTVAAGNRANGQTTTGSYVIELLGGGTSMGSTTLVNPNTGISTGTWLDMVLTINAATAAPFVGQDLQIRLTANGDQQGQFDNVRLDASPATGPVIPAPAALPAGLAMIAFIAARRRRR